jgi:predicted ester cyclase
MSVERNKASVRPFIEEPWNKGELATLDELCAPNYILHGLGGLQELKIGCTDVRRAFPDFHFTVEEMIAEGDKVAFRWTTWGTHQGEYEGIAPTGKVVTTTGITILRFAEGKIVEDRFESGSPGLRQQLM